ncbi:MAG TPA: helicase HerA-like domain-containing protein [Xanthomonadales bacterium]|nr:helicase HerA-like domain-containing protein [Xanthomonadales bacterium]
MADILLGRGDTDVRLLGKYANRHGLIAGATGTGKSVSLMLLAEGFSAMGVPVFLADVKGDLAGLSQPAVVGDKLKPRLERLGLTGFQGQASPVVFWDLFGQKGHPVRTTISEMGPFLLARLLELNDVQTGVLQVVFRLADDEALLLLDLDDLRAMLAYTSEHAKEISGRYGLVSPASVAAIQRALLALENEGAKDFFAEPALDLADFMRQDMSGRGIVNILSAERLILKPRLYASFLLWMLSELFERLPEVGDLDQPKLVFFFDEAHLLFDDAPPALLERVEQVVRLIRSKGVGVYFITQLPDDVPPDILGQLGNRVQHALRAFTPRDQKAVRTAAETFAPNPKFKVVDVITQLGVGEALVSTLQEGGIPLPVEKTYMCPPHCRIGTITDEERTTIRSRSPVGGKYDTRIDRESAEEVLAAREARGRAEAPAPAPATRGRAATPRAEAPAPAPAPAEGGGFGQSMKDWLFGTKRRQGAVETMAKSTARTVGNQLGRQILRGLLGGISRKR